MDEALAWACPGRTLDVTCPSDEGRACPALMPFLSSADRLCYKTVQQALAGEAPCEDWCAPDPKDAGAVSRALRTARACGRETTLTCS